MVYTLEILAENEEVKSWYQQRSNYTDDSGVDLYTPEDYTFKLGQTKFISMKIKCRMLNENGRPVGYYLYSRSSISKTPLMLANGVGIVDLNYRGNLTAALRYLPSEEDMEWITSCADLFRDKYDDPKEYTYTIQKGSRLVQICGPTLEPIVVKLVDSLDQTDRGTGSFGSTN
jgi:dUTP pyrophosphatase